MGAKNKNNVGWIVLAFILVVVIIILCARLGSLTSVKPVDNSATLAACKLLYENELNIANITLRNFYIDSAGS